MLWKNPRLVRARTLVCGLIASAAILASPLVAQEDFTPLDALMLKSVSGAYPSPAGDAVVFTRSEPRVPAQAPGSQQPD